MKSVRIIKLLLPCIFFIIPHSQAQMNSTSYEKRAAEIQSEIWGNEQAQFRKTDVPDKYRNESAVILGRYFKEENGLNNDFYGYYTTIRERVKINDKAALEEFATLEYTKELVKTSKSFLRKRKTKSSYRTFIGLKIIKPGGRIEIIDTREEVLTKNEENNREGKITVPALEVGDILDYYVRVEDEAKNIQQVRGPYLFIMRGKHPILYYGIKFRLFILSGVDEMSANEAKPFVQKVNEDHHIVLEANEEDLPKFEDVIWKSESRELPYHVVGYVTSPDLSHYLRGSILHGPFTYEYRNNLKLYYLDKIKTNKTEPDAEREMKVYFKDRLEGIAADSIVSFLYNYFRWKQYKVSGGGTDTDDGGNKRLDWLNTPLAFSETLYRLNIDHEIVFSGNRYSRGVAEIFRPDDYTVFLKINKGGKFDWVSFEDFFQLPGELPAKLQGEEVYVVTRSEGKKGASYIDNGLPTKLPVEKFTDNGSAEKLFVSFDSADLQVLKINRNVELKGSSKLEAQKKLLLEEDVQRTFSKLVNKPDILALAQLSSKTSQGDEELKHYFVTERLKQEALFLDEIKTHFGRSAKDLLKFNIDKTGLLAEDPVFKFSEDFKSENLVKKGANNYIVEAGRFIGVEGKEGADERERLANIYIPFAKSDTCTISIKIPNGYTAKGLEGFNKKVINETASFASSSQIDGNNVIITASIKYFSNFEVAANWHKILEVIDAVSAFSNQKLLIEKVK